MRNKVIDRRRGDVIWARLPLLGSPTLEMPTIGATRVAIGEKDVTLPLAYGVRLRMLKEAS